jgi:hypothetical protein
MQSLPSSKIRDEKFSHKCLSLSKVFLYPLSDLIIKILLVLHRNILSPTEEKAFQLTAVKRMLSLIYQFILDCCVVIKTDLLWMLRPRIFLWIWESEKIKDKKQSTEQYMGFFL